MSAQIESVPTHDNNGKWMAGCSSRSHNDVIQQCNRSHQPSCRIAGCSTVQEVECCVSGPQAIT